MLLSRCNSSAANNLKIRWVPLSVARLAQGDMAKRLNCDKFSFLSFENCEEQLGWEEIETNFMIVRDKIVEVTAVRGLVRPVPSGSTRKAVVDQALEVIQQIEAVPPPALSIMLTKASEAKQ